MTDIPAGLTDEELGLYAKHRDGPENLGFDERELLFLNLSAERTKSRELEVDAAAMRGALEAFVNYHDWPNRTGFIGPGDNERYDAALKKVREALSSSAGQSLLDVAETARILLEHLDSSTEYGTVISGVSALEPIRTALARWRPGVEKRE